MIKNFDKFTGANIIDMFSVMYSPSIIRAAARNVNHNGRFMTLAKKYCKDINIKGIYAYAYIKAQRLYRDIAIVFLYGKSNTDKVNQICKIVPDTYIGDNIFFIYIDELENCKDFYLINNMRSDFHVIMRSDFVIEVLLGIIATNDKLYVEYMNNWKDNIFDCSDKYDYSEQKVELNHLINMYRETSSNEVVREINYGEIDYSELRDACWNFC